MERGSMAWRELLCHGMFEASAGADDEAQGQALVPRDGADARCA